MYNEAIRAASEADSAEVVELLLRDPRVDPSALDNEAIRGASETGIAEVIELLLRDPRVDPSANNNESIGNAVSAYYDVRGFMDKGMCNDDFCQDHLKVVRLLLQDERVRLGFMNHKTMDESVLDVVLPILEEHYDRMMTVIWTGKMIGQGWGDLGEIIGKRLFFKELKPESKRKKNGE